MSVELGIAGLMHAPSSSAAGVVSFLEEEDDQIKVRALEKLYRIIDVHWAEVRMHVLHCMTYFDEGIACRCVTVCL